MKQKLAIVVHKFDRSLLMVRSQSDLSTLLGVSISTIKRKYNEIGIYDTSVYTVYIGPKFYDNGIESKYKHDVIPPTPKLYNEHKRAIIAQEIVQTEPLRPINSSFISISKDIKTIEDELSEDNLITDKDYHAYYSTKSLEELTKSKNYYKYHAGRVKVIDHYALILMNE